MTNVIASTAGILLALKIAEAFNTSVEEIFTLRAQDDKSVLDDGRAEGLASLMS